MIKLRVPTNASIYFGLAAGVIYGFLIRFLFSNYHLQDYWTVMTIGFMFLGPVRPGNPGCLFRRSRRSAIMEIQDLHAAGAGVIASVDRGHNRVEGRICLIMALPIFMVMSSAGGLAAGIFSTAKNSRGRKVPFVVFFALAPLISSAIETRLPLPQAMRIVETQITINAQPHAVWQNIDESAKSNLRATNRLLSYAGLSQTG